MYRVVASVLTFAFLASVAAAEDVFVLEKSRPVTIVVADSPAIAEQTAAKELDTYVSRMTGVPCVIVPEAKAAGCAIYVGPTALAKQAGIDCRELDKEQSILRSRDGNLRSIELSERNVPDLGGAELRVVDPLEFAAGHETM